MRESARGEVLKRAGGGTSGLPVGISAESVRRELQRALNSQNLVHSERLRRFLTFVVERTISGHADQLKEYVIGLSVFDKDDSFDPRLDPIVRVEAGRLRAKLTRYYETEGLQDPLVIEFSRGSYTPTFLRREPHSPASTAAEAGQEKRTVAVLPFSDQSPDKDQEYFCEGMSIELISALTKLENLRVPAWSSTRQFKGQDYDIREIGARLRVEAVLEGSVRKEGEHLRIAAQLVDVSSGCGIWSETYDREMRDIFTIQEEISRAIVDTLKVRLGGGGRRRLVKQSTESSSAYRRYLKGRYYWNRRSQKGLTEGLRYFEKALEVDPAYALAYTGVADSHALLGNYGVLPTHMVRARAKEAAVKAVELDATLAEAHTSLGHVAATYDWDWEMAEREFETAIQLGDNYATAHHWYAITCLMPLRRLDEALLEIRRAQELDPISVVIARDLALVLYCRREYSQAATQALRTLELDPSFYEAYWILGLISEQQGRFTAACEAFQKGVSLSRTPRLVGALGHCYAAMGEQQHALLAIRELGAISQRRYVSPFDTAIVYMGLGDKDRAFEWLDKALAQRCYEMVWLKADPRWDVLRSDGRFISIINAIGLEPEVSGKPLDAEVTSEPSA